MILWSRISGLAVLRQNQFVLDNNIEQLIYEINMMMRETLPSRQNYVVLDIQVFCSMTIIISQ
jgi:hypothetical protein